MAYQESLPRVCSLISCDNGIPGPPEHVHNPSPLDVQNNVLTTLALIWESLQDTMIRS
jgi:hypothetical protein